MTKRIVIQMANGAIDGVLTNFENLEVVAVDVDDEVMSPIDELLEAANGGKVEVDDKIDVSYEPDLVRRLFEHAQG